MSLTRYIINSAITAATLFAFNANAAAPTYIIQLGIAAENFEGFTETYNQLTGSVRYSKGLSRRSVVNLNADLYTKKNTDTDQKDSNGLLIEVVYSFIPKSGFSEPVYSLALRHELESSDNAFRDYSKTSLVLADTLRFNDVVTVTGGLEAIVQNFETSEKTAMGLFINTDLLINEDFIVYVNFKFQDEDIESTSADNISTLLDTVAARDAVSLHHEFNSTTANPSLPDTGSIFTTGVNYSINSQNFIDFSYQSSTYTQTDDNEINVTMISLDYFYKF